ncbi:MAG TPA: hypothetical protein DCS09_01190 [Porphyromonadaceae bacterium]|nr:MAG: hypothetical protein A2Y38_18535 [Spirochaetes bacterium GWB1_59_5]HAR37293.1 hypothetical protein [Porphyromonadaceae bacterium]
MALRVAIGAEHNSSGVYLNDVYIRIGLVSFYPKIRMLKAVVYGFINSESGQLSRIREDAESIEFSDALSATPLGFISGSFTQTLGVEFSRSLQVLQTFRDPMFLFTDIYHMAVPKETSIDNESLWPYVYGMIRNDPRFENVRDDI